MDKKCPNCNQIIESKYCAECGTLRTGRRLTLNDIVATAADSVLNLDNSLFRTIVQLFKDPYIVVQQYWNGYRKYYMNPFRFFLVSLLVVGLKIYFGGSNLFVIDIGLDDASWSKEMIVLVTRIIFFTFFSLFVFRKLNPTYSEHLVATIYIISFVSILEFPFSLITEWSKWIEKSIQVIFAIYTFYALTRAYIPSSNKRAIKKGVFSYFAFLIVLLCLLASISFLLT